MGDSLGGKPKDPKYSLDGKVSYNLIQQQDWFKDALSKLIALAKNVKLAILCAEENPTHCHREKLVAINLRQQGVEVYHIRRDGLDRGNKSLDQYF